MKRWLGFAPAFAWALGILWIGSRPSIPLPVVFPYIDKVGHFAMFGVLGALLALGLHRAGARASIAWPLLFGAAIGVLDELHQRTVPGRSSDWRDLAADIAGCAIGLWLSHAGLEWRARRRRRAREERHSSKTIQDQRA